MEFSEQQIANLKMLLNSRESSKQMAALKWIVSAFEKADDTTKNTLIKSLMNGYVLDCIYEIIGTLDVNVQREIVRCMEYFPNCREFYETDSWLELINAIIRTMQYLLNQPDTSDIMMRFLKLLAASIEGLQVSSVKTSLMYNVTHIVSPVLVLLKTGNFPLKMIALEVIRQILRNFRGKRGEGLNDGDVQTVLNAMQIIFVPTSEVDDIFMMLKIGFSCLNCCEDLDAVHKGMKQIILDIIFNFLNDVATPFIFKTFTPTYWLLYDSFLGCLRKLYKMGRNHLNLLPFSRKLGALDIFTLISIRIKKCSRRQKSKHLTTLFEILASLSIVDLNIAENFPDIIEMYRENLFTGIQGFSDDPQSWPKISQMNAFVETSHAILIFGYFYTINKKSSMIHFFHLEDLISVMNQLEEPMDLPIYITKALWLNFAVAYLPYIQTFHLNLHKESIQRVVALISDRPHEVFTYHPAILFWTFLTPDIPRKIQLLTLMLWIYHEVTNNIKSPNTATILEEFVAHNSAVSDCLLDLVHRAPLMIVNHAICVFWKAIQIQDHVGVENLRGKFLDVLPEMLLKIDEKENTSDGETTTGMLLKLACFAIPKQPNSHAIFCCVSKITGLLADHLSPHVKLALLEFNFCVIQITSNYMVLNSYVNNRTFILRLWKLSCTEKSVMSLIATKILSYLLFQQSRQSLSSGAGINLNPIDFLELLFNKTESFLLAGLQLLYNILGHSDPIYRPIIYFSLDYEIIGDILRALYFRLQMMFAKNNLRVERFSWKCQAVLLDYTKRHFEKTALAEHICTQPWSYVLIKLKMKNPFQYWDYPTEMLNFIRAWLMLLTPFVPTKPLRRNIRHSSKDMQQQEHFALNDSLNIIATSFTFTASHGTNTNTDMQFVIKIMLKMEALICERLYYKLNMLYKKNEQKSSAVYKV